MKISTTVHFPDGHVWAHVPPSGWVYLFRFWMSPDGQPTVWFEVEL